MARTGVIDIETGLAFATNPGNLRLELADLLEESGNQEGMRPSNSDVLAESELEIHRLSIG